MRGIGIMAAVISVLLGASLAMVAMLLALAFGAGLQ